MGKFKYEVYDYSNVEICKPKNLSAAYTASVTTVERELTAILSEQIAAVERELTAILSEQIAAEIDRSILANLNTYSISSTGHLQ